MTYSAIAQAAQDEHLRRRIAACIAQEDGADPQHPIAHADAIIWRCCAAPGWGEAYAYALGSAVPEPGNDPAVITDAMILAVVQPLITEEASDG